MGEAAGKKNGRSASFQSSPKKIKKGEAKI
jgi:hypothetical protein